MSGTMMAHAQNGSPSATHSDRAIAARRRHVVVDVAVAASPSPSWWSAVTHHHRRRRQRRRRRRHVVALVGVGSRRSRSRGVRSHAHAEIMLIIYLNAHYSVIGERYERPHRRHAAHCAETGRGEEREEEKHYTLRDACKTAAPRRNADESASFPLSLGQFRSLPTMRGAAYVAPRQRRPQVAPPRAPPETARSRGARARAQLGPPRRDV